MPVEEHADTWRQQSPHVCFAAAFCTREVAKGKLAAGQQISRAYG
jgi:hypothetical protein